MWRRSFLATSVALGAGLDDALGAIETGDRLDAGAVGLVTALRAPERATRAAALAAAVRDIVLAIDEATLR